MSTSRASKIEQLGKSLRKHYKLIPTATERSVMDHLIYACVLEDASYEAADEAFAKLLQNSVGYNEIRVTTLIELAETLANIPRPNEAALRIKRILQSVYDTRYSYEIDDLKKSNLAKATETINGFRGMSPFVAGYVSQIALGAHSIPLGAASLKASVALELITAGESEKGIIPGLERAIPKAKGLEFAQLIHQFGVEFVADYKLPNVAAVFKDLKVKYEPVVEPVAEPKVKKPASKKVAATKVDETPIEEIVPAKPVAQAKPSKKVAANKPKASPPKKVVDVKVPAKKAATKAQPTKKKVSKSQPANAKKAPDTKASKTVKKAVAKNSKATTALSKKKPR